MSAPWTNWNHITKIDPDKTLVDGETFEDVCATGTDALEIGGTTGMTEEKMQRVIDACAKYSIPVYQEPSNPAVVLDHPGLDGYLIPTVLNASDPSWIIGAHQEWVRMSDNLNWEHIFMQGYIVLNPDASVASYTDANCDQTPEEVAALAEAGEQCFGQEIIYLEYSGTLGDIETIKATQTALEDATLFYGGGIHDYESAAQMAEYADTIIVGNLLHDEGVGAIEQTVNAAKNR